MTDTQATSRASAHAHAVATTRRRNRLITSCLECRRRKLKCSKTHPCDHCQKGNRDCVFLAPARDPASQSRLNHLKDSIELIEKELEAGADNIDDTRWVISAQNTKPIKNEQGLVEGDARDAILEPTPLAVDAIAYEDDEDDPLEDLGVQLGRMRVTERIGGSVRPMFSFEIADVMRRSTSESARNGLATEQQWVDSLSPEEYLAPGPEFRSPGSSLYFPALVAQNLSLINFLPTRQTADILLQEYWSRVHLVTHLVHRPSFERQYTRFWQAVSTGYEPAFSIQAVVFASLFAAVASMPSSMVTSKLGATKQDMVNNLQTAVEYALTKANVMKTTKTETLQAFTMYLIPLCGKEMTRAHGTITSMAIRLAMMAGLHKDGTEFGLSPVETHVRRLIWHTLIRLDARTAQAVGPMQSQIRHGEYSTQLPLNVDDVDLEGLLQPTKDANRFTDNTLNRLRLEISLFNSEIFAHKQKVDRRQAVLAAVLKKVEEWFKVMEAKYRPILNTSIPIQDFAWKLLQANHQGFYIGLLHVYVVSAPAAMPERLVDVVWHAGLNSCELHIVMETDPRFEPWWWYASASQNWHTALLMFAEITRKPDRPDADRAWRVLDYVFELPKQYSPREKMIHLAYQARSRMGEYERRRRRRLPVELQRSLGVTHWSQAHTSTEKQSTMAQSPGSPAAIGGDDPSSRRTSNGPKLSQSSRPELDSPPTSFSYYPDTQNSPGTFGASYSQQGFFPPQNMGTPSSDMFAEANALQDIEWDEVDKLLQMDTTMDFGDPTVFSNPFAPGMMSEFDASALSEMSMPSSTTMMPPPLWGRDKNHPSS